MADVPAAVRTFLDEVVGVLSDYELARPHGVRARHYLEHGTWMTKAEARR